MKSSALDFQKERDHAFDKEELDKASSKPKEDVKSDESQVPLQKNFIERDAGLGQGSVHSSINRLICIDKEEDLEPLPDDIVVGLEGSVNQTRQNNKIKRKFIEENEENDEHILLSVPPSSQTFYSLRRHSNEQNKGQRQS